MDSALEILQKLIINDGKCVTKASVLRQSSLNTRQVESAMSQFYEQHNDLSAMFIILGTSMANDKASLIRRSIICKQEKVEEMKKAFEKVISVSVYSLHRNSATSLHALLNSNWSGQNELAGESLERRIHIVSLLALKGRKEWQAQNPEPASSGFVIPEYKPKAKKKAKAIAKSMIVKNDQQSLKDAFATAAKKNEGFSKEESEKPTERFEKPAAVKKPRKTKKPPVKKGAKKAKKGIIKGQQTLMAALEVAAKKNRRG